MIFQSILLAVLTSITVFAADTQPPSIKITWPNYGSTFVGKFNFNARATDNVGVRRVDYYINNVLKAQDATDPYSATIDISNYANGEYNLKAVAVDTSGNTQAVFTKVSFNNSEDTTASSKKLVPGHYLAGGKVFPSVDSLMGYIKSPNVRGIQLRYFWRDLETSFGNYNFDKIQYDLNVLKANNRRLIVMVIDKDFNDTKPTPAYLDNYIYKFTSSSGDGPHSGYCAKRWSPYVVERLRLLHVKIAERFDDDPNFEGVAMQETALGDWKADEKPADYSADKYAEALIQITRNAKAAFRKSNFFFYANFLKGGNNLLYDVAEAYAPTRALMGGPDVTPDASGHIKFVTPYYQYLKETYFNQKFCSYQRASYTHIHESGPRIGQYWTLTELFNFALSNYGCDYMIWNIKIGSSDILDSAGRREYETKDALDLISRIGSF